MAEKGVRKGQAVFLTALAGGATVRDAAREAGISERTAHRRMRDPGFRYFLERLQVVFIDRAVGRLAKASTAAADRLRDLLDSPSEKIRLAAARYVLEHSRRVWERRRDEWDRSIGPAEAEQMFRTVFEAIGRAVPELDQQARIAEEVKTALAQQEAQVNKLGKSRIVNLNRREALLFTTLPLIAA
jgi:hypothetical protein